MGDDDDDDLLDDLLLSLTELNDELNNNEDDKLKEQIYNGNSYTRGCTWDDQYFVKVRPQKEIKEILNVF